ncbi:MAG: HD domain-containing protein [Eubacterium sp.]
MSQSNKLLANPIYRDYLERIEKHEVDRCLCGHNLEHFLDVARIASIMAFEESLNLSRDLIYTTAFLHDIGRFLEYEENIPHEKASHTLAKEFLKNLKFSEDEKAIILDAILNHRNSNSSGFNKIFYNADKKSRPCYRCKARDICNWNITKQNLKIHY